MTKLEKIILIIILIAIPIGIFIFWKGNKIAFDVSSTESGKNIKKDNKKKEDKKSGKKNKKGKREEKNPSAGITIIEKWEMPPALVEISGIAYLGNNQFACVQDELGKIFIYNTGNGKVEKEIPFAGTGDYEGIAVKDKTAYVLRADGNIFEVNDLIGNYPTVKQYDTPLTVKQDAEGLCYDQKNNRLLIAIKGKDLNETDYKGIYAFDMTTGKMAEIPVLKIDLTHSIFNESNKKKPENILRPSEIAIHPVTGDIYIIDGGSARLLIMDARGKINNLYQLRSSEFPQPEGIAFSPTGELFVSNEGGKGVGNILKISIQNNEK